MNKVKVFKPNHKYRLTKNYHREAWPLINDAKCGDILIFEYKAIGGFVQFLHTKCGEDGIYRPVMMKGTEAFRLFEDIDDVV